MARGETGRAGPVAVPRGGTGVRAAVQREERAVSAERGPGLDRLPRDVQLGSKVRGSWLVGLTKGVLSQAKTFRSTCYVCHSYRE